MSDARKRALAVILTLSLIPAWLALDRAGGSNPLRDAFSEVISPVQYVLRRLTQPLLQLVERAQRLGQLASDNDALREENAALRSRLVLLRESQIENETLRRQLDFKSSVPNFHLLSAEVIGYDPSNLLQYLIIDRGAKDDIAASMPVLAAEGLVGRISEVSASSSKVMLITDPSSSVSASIQRSRATGVVQGLLGRELLMRYIPQGDTVITGDVVLTSGLGANFPKRLVIGQVADVRHEDVQMFQEARLVPAVNLRDLQVVMVLLNFEPSELVQGQTPDSTPPVGSQQ